MPETDQDRLRERDSVALLLMGSFFVVLATLVLIGSFWAEGISLAVGVNLGCGGVLLLVGFGMILLGRRWRTRSNPPDGGAQR